MVPWRYSLRGEGASRSRKRKRLQAYDPRQMLAIETIYSINGSSHSENDYVRAARIRMPEKRSDKTKEITKSARVM